jgi:hypothetical protein
VSWLRRLLGRKAPGTDDGLRATPAGLALSPEDQLADMPIGFGYKVAWLAVKTHDANAVVQKIGLRDPKACNWRRGIDLAYAQEQVVFVTPPLGEWTLALGRVLAEQPDLPANAAAMLRSLGKQFGETQYFMTHRGIDAHLWAKADGETLIRGYGYVGDSGETIWDEGPQTPEEVGLGFSFFDERSPEVEIHPDYWGREDLTYPDESHVMQLAGRWSIDPTKIEEQFSQAGIGVVGMFKPTEP